MGGVLPAFVLFFLITAAPLPAAADPGAPSWSESLPRADAWRTDRRLSTGTALRVVEGERLSLEGAYPGSAAAVVSGLWHWAGASALQLELEVPPEGAGTKAMVFLRVGKSSIFESPLLTLEAGRQTLRWSLDSGDGSGVEGTDGDSTDGDSAWHLADPTGKGRQMMTHDLLTVRELGLRFFFDRRATFAVELSPPTVLGPGPGKEPLGILDIRSVHGQTITAFSTFELDFQLSRTFRQPYDPEHIAVDLEVTPEAAAEDGTRQHPAFFHVPYELVIEDGVERAVQKGPASWRARFCPWRTGVHRWRLRARAGDGEVATAEGSFEVGPADPEALWGFVRVAGSDPRRLELVGSAEDGSESTRPYYPIGLNLRSPADERPGAYGGPVLAAAIGARRQGTRAYERWLERLGEAGGNFGRIWLAPWWGGLEWNGAEDDGAGAGAVPYEGLGYFHQANAARIDRLIELAEQNGIRLAIETLPHGLVSSEVDADWHRNPYNAHHGGPVPYATDFFRHPEAVRGHRRMLRHAVARWGASPALAFWGLLTEAEWSEPWYRSLPLALRREMSRENRRATRSGRGALARPEPYANPDARQHLVDWLVSTAEYLKTTDAHPHLTTAQFSIPAFGLELWHRPGLDIVHNNAYLHLAKRWQAERFEEYAGIADMLRVFGQTYRQLYARPILVGEWGGHPKRNASEALLAELHVGLWAAQMTDLSGATGFWWWNLVDAEDAWSHFAALARFAAGEDRRGIDFVSSRGSVHFPTSEIDRRALVRHAPDRLRAYVFAEALNRPFAGLAAEGADDPRLPESGPGVLELPADLLPGNYRLEIWDTFEGTVIASEVLTIGQQSGPSSRLLPLPDHRVDLALKLDSVVE